MEWATRCDMIGKNRLIGRFIKVPKYLCWLRRELPFWLLMLCVAIALVVGFQLGVLVSGG